GVHAIDVEPVRGKKKEHRLEYAYLAEGGDELSPSFACGVKQAWRAARRLAHEQEHRNRKQAPPHRHGNEGHAHRFRRVGETEAFRLQRHPHIDREQQATAEITKGVTEAGDEIEVT